jgi:hypothetical protein
MKTQVVIAGPVLDALLELSLLLDKRFYSVFVIEAQHPVRRLLLEGAGDPDGAVVHLLGNENVVELRRLLEAFPSTRFIFLVAQMPLHAAAARMVGEHGSTVLRRDELPVFIMATLVALLAPRAVHRSDNVGA